MCSRVWVLGAGFSRSLGGPLLNDLFTPSSRRYVTSSFPEIGSLAPPGCVDLVHGHYRQGGPNRPASERNRGNFPVQWRNAEQYLEKLDEAVARGETSPEWKVITEGSDEFPLRDLAHHARRWLAGECSAFVKNAKPQESERWIPYLRWAMSLTPGDTVITFNYDPVLETLDQFVRTTKDQTQPVFEFVLPGTPSRNRELQPFSDDFALLLAVT